MGVGVGWGAEPHRQVGHIISLAQPTSVAQQERRGSGGNQLPELPSEILILYVLLAVYTGASEQRNHNRVGLFHVTEAAREKKGTQQYYGTSLQRMHCESHHINV